MITAPFPPRNLWLLNFYPCPGWPQAGAIWESIYGIRGMNLKGNLVHQHRCGNKGRALLQGYIKGSAMMLRVNKERGWVHHVWHTLDVYHGNQRKERIMFPSPAFMILEGKVGIFTENHILFPVVYLANTVEWDVHLCTCTCITYIYILK